MAYNTDPQYRKRANSKIVHHIQPDSKLTQSALLPCRKEGWLLKRGEIVKNWKRRYFTLKDNKLSYYKILSD